MTQEGFSKGAQENTKHEIDRALSFAADVAQGGPVVVHVGEFQRPIFEATKEMIKKEIDAAVKFALESPAPLENELLSEVGG